MTNSFPPPPSPEPWFLFDASSAPTAFALRLRSPVGIIESFDPDGVEAALTRVEKAIDSGLFAAGFLSYEAGYALEPRLRPLMPKRRRLPLLWFGLFAGMERLRGADLAALFKGKTADKKPGRLTRISPAMSQKDYQKRFILAKELIASGDIYQVNLAFKLLFEHQGAPFGTYAHLRDAQPVRYGGFLETPGFSLLSFSPELFFEVKKEHIHTRPMKGTIKRGRARGDDQKLYERLLFDPKNRAENLMIVDLMRNDLARIAQPGSVEVSDLYRVEPYPTLYQMTSGINAELRPDISLPELAQALFPAGSITGAPKIRAMEVIRELENTPRGAYCGAMGIISRNPAGSLSCLFNVAIRTLTLFPDGSGETGIGSGIVQDSVGENEYEECLLKAKFMHLPDHQLIETMRLDRDGSYYLLEHHLARLERSARAFDFFYPEDDIRRALSKIAGRDKGKYMRVRLLLYPAGGRIELSATPIEAPDPEKIVRFALSNESVDSADHLLQHKTTHRDLFEGEWRHWHETEGADEVLFCNERGELTEGARSNLFVERNGKLLTPPLTCGLLPGTLREALIEEGRAVEAVLYPDDLTSADIFLGNSVRGLQPAKPLT